MVQIISLDNLTPQNLEKLDKKDIKLTNTDFLELLLKDIETDTNKSNTEKTKKLKNSTIQETDITIDKNMDIDKLVLDLQTSKDIKNLTEIKNIITSKFKQDNIILSKQETKEFKQIDNLKDLIKFADKKGLNIEKLKFDIKPKNQKVDIKNTNSLFTTTSHKHKIDLTKNDKKETLNKNSISLENIINTKQKKSKTINKSEIKTEINKTNIKQTEQKKEIKLDKNIEISTKNDNKNTQTIDTQSINLTTLLKKDKLSTNENDTHTIIHKDNTKNKNIKITNLESLLNPKDDIKPKKVESKENNNLGLNQQNMVNDIKAKSIQAKETINHFKQNLDEAIKNYKPPISKVDIELNPKNLGKVEVTIVQRGNNIQVNMNTDHTNVQMFQTHQAEFRQALANIGFSNIDMSFNSNQDRDRKQNQAKKTYKENENMELEMGDIEIKADYQYA